MQYLSFLAPLALSACGQTLYYAPPRAETELRVNARAETVVVNDVSMPEYAINQEIPIQRPDGGLVTDTDRLWADLPDRALKISLVRHLNQITDAQVSVEPWPLAGFPEVEVTVTVENMIIRADNQLSFTGTYALRNETDLSGRIEVFSIAVPVPGLDYPAILAAHEVAWLRLAEQIARSI
jgi:uncharacterized lipoprotein YmbA